MTFRLEKFDGAAITDEMIVAAADLFSQNYGVWGPQAAERMGVKRLKHGARVKMSSSKIISQVLPNGANNVYIRAVIERPSLIDIGNVPQPKVLDELAGNIFATRWTYNGRQMIWITQLCVSGAYRSQGIAKKLVEALRENERGMGVLSSHAHAILAVLHVYGRPTEMVDLTMTQDHARAIMDSCPVQYVKEAKLHGSLFGEVDDGSVSCADTQFWVDHEEPLKALDAVRAKGIAWPFGELPEGHEFLVLVKARGKDSRADKKSSEF